MGDGRVVVTLDMNGLIDVWGERVESEGVGAPIDIPEPEVVREKPVVMVVDDSVTVRKFTSRMLTRAGFDVEAARDGMDALRMVHDNKPDLMLLDLEMPRMDGFELLGILRSTKQFEDLPVIVITSRTGDKHRERGLSLGAQKYFGKPYREDELLPAIWEVLEESGVKRDEYVSEEGEET